MGEWRLQTIGDLVTLQRGIDLPDHQRTHGEIPIMGSFGVTGRHNIAACQGPGVTVGRSGASAGTVCYIEEDYWPLNTCLYVRDFKGNDARFAYYFLKTIDLAGMNSGSAQPSLNRNFVHPMPVRFPDPPEQRAIAAVLSALDEKIELNRQMNETLEANARTLFRDWFVDFGPTRAKAEGRPAYLASNLWALFPERLGDDEVPEGWQIERAGEIFDIAIGRTPPRKEQEHFVDGDDGVPWLSIRTMGGGDAYIFATEEALTADAVRTYRVPYARVGTVLVSFKLTVGRVAIAGVDVTTNEAIAHFNQKQETRFGSEYTYLWLKCFDFDTLGSTSSIATAVNTQSMKSIPFLVPDRAILEAAADCLAPIFARIRCNLIESRTLAATRNALLPKLTAGQIRLRDAEALAA